MKVKNDLDKIVYGQHNAKNRLLAAILSDIELFNDNKKFSQTNILLYGPTGSGKTFLVENLCKIINIPFYVIDASKLTQTGYAGYKVEHTIEQIIRKMNGNVTLAERALIFIDEFDKLHLSESSYFHSDIAGLGVQYELLKLMEGADYLVEYNNQQISVKTQNFIIVCAGAFSHNNNFDADECGSWLKGAGFIEELIGRFSHFIRLEPYKKDDYYQLMRLELSTAYLKYKYLLSKHGINLEIDEEDYIQIVEKTASSSFGVRTLNLLLEKHCSDIYYNSLLARGETDI